jgi:hypothetical protein
VTSLTLVTLAVVSVIAIARYLALALSLYGFFIEGAVNFARLDHAPEQDGFNEAVEGDPTR